MALCEKTVDILGNLAPDRSFFEQCPIKSEELDDYKILQGNLKTKAIDQITAAERQQIMDTRLKGNTTLIAVIHRLDIVKNCDKIGVLKSGKIEEMGTYDELMEKKGLLYELVLGKR